MSAFVPATCDSNMNDLDLSEETTAIKVVALLREANCAFNASPDLDDILPAILAIVVKAVPISGASLWLLESRRDEMVCRQAWGLGSEALLGSRVSKRAGIFRRLYDAGQTFQIGAQPDGALPDALATSASGAPARWLLCIPLPVPLSFSAPIDPTATSATIDADESILGAMILSTVAAQGFDPLQQALLQALADAASTAIGNAQRYECARQQMGKRINSERALREGESRYRTLIETSPDAILVMDLYGTINACNGQALNLYGYPNQSELIGTHLLSLIVPEDRVRASQHIRRILHGDTSNGIELVHLRRDGSTFDARSVGSLIADSTGAASAIVEFVTDITAEKSARRTMQNRNLELRILNRIANQMSQTQDPEQLATIALELSLQALEEDTGWITVFGDQKSTGYNKDVTVERGKLLNPDFSDLRVLIHKWAESQVRDAKGPVLGSPEQLAQADSSLEAQYRIAGVPLLIGDEVKGVLVVVNMDHAPLRAFHAQKVHLLSAIAHQASIAIDNAKWAARAKEVDLFRELDKMRSSLLASFSHDLRSPLGIITMACTTLLRKDLHLDETTHDEMLTDIQIQAERLLRLVESILDLSTIQDGDHWLRRDVFDLRGLACRLIRSLNRTSEIHSIELDLPDTPLWLYADPDRIEQVLLNLLDNAIKYSPDGGRIVLHATQQNSSTLIQVQDAGIGIAGENLNFIFERFYRIRDQATKHISGAGLGLSLCKAIIEAHGGTIWAESHSGKGTTMHIKLPNAPILLADADLNA